MNAFGKAQEASGGTFVSWAYTDLKLCFLSVENKTLVEFESRESITYAVFEVMT